MAPPPKRRKRNVIVSSPPTSSNEDSDYDGSHTTKVVDLISSSPAGLSQQIDRPKLVQSTLPGTPTKAKTANHPHNAAPIHLPTKSRGKSASVSPEKAKGGKAKNAEIGKSGNLYTMFSNQAQRQVPLQIRRSAATTIPTSAREEEDDAISDDDDVGAKQSSSVSFIGAAARKRARDNGLGDVEFVSGSQKFMKKAANKQELKYDEDTRPWAERFAPANLEELAVHKKKVSDVNAWLESVFGGQMRQRLLVLKGAAGTGKTTTVQLLAKSLDCEVLEWRNPLGSVASSEGFVSAAAQFEEFVGKGSKYGQLDIISESATAPPEISRKPLDRRKNLILVEEFPNTFTRSSTAMKSFRSALLQYLASNVPLLSMMYNNEVQHEQITPLVMVVSETLLTTSTASADSFTAHRLLGPEILQHPGVSVIEFNAIAPTLLAKALELIVIKEARKSGRRKTPGPLVLKRIGEIGDIRSAIGSLEFLCLRGDDGADWGAKVAFTKSKKAKDTPLTRMEEQSLELVTRREASLGIFHAVGKVVYNKREDEKRSDDVEKLPSWIEDRARPKCSQIHVDELIDETGTDTSTFVAALHENYILSCDANAGDVHDFSDLDHVIGCLDAFSDSDLLCPSWDGSLNSSGFGGGVGGNGTGGDILRQDEMCFQLAVRGVLFSLPYPVKRKAPAGQTQMRGGSQFKMFYPTSLKLWRTQEEISSLIDLWVARAMKGDDQRPSGITSGAAAFVKQSSSSEVESWKSRATAFSSQPPNRDEPATPSSDDGNSASLIGTGSSAKKEMLLERLPYMALIATARKGGTSPIIREMERITVFTGIGGTSEEEDGPVEDNQPAEAWATDKPGEGDEAVHKRSRGFKKGAKMSAGTIGLEERFAEHKLVLSDDDIEDD